MGFFARLFSGRSRADSASPVAFGNPLERWQESFQRANELMRLLDFEGALALLAPAAETTQGFSEGRAEFLQGMTVEKMATCHLESGRAEAAIPLYRQAATLCRTARYDDGLISCLNSLFEAHRYLDQSAEAADVAAECAEVLERSGQEARARRFRKVADIVRRGEPLCRVVLQIDGAFLELDEIPPVIAGDLHFIFFYKRMFLARAAALVQRGRELCTKGHFEQALPLFQEASRIDPHAPAPPYEEAAALLYLQRPSEAVSCYDKVEALAPGWFHCRADRWLAAEIAAGRIPHAAFPLLRRLENMDPSPDDKLQLARQGISQFPGVPVFQLHLGIQLSMLGQRDESREAFAEGLRQAEEPDLRSRLLVQSVLFDPPSPERDRKLREAMAPGGNLPAAAMAAVMLAEGFKQVADVGDVH